MSQPDTIPVQNLTLGLAAGFGVIAAIVVVVLFASKLGLEDTHEQSADLISERIKPIGQVKVAGVEGSGPASETPTTASAGPVLVPPATVETPTKPAASYEPSPIDLAQGQEIYDTTCALCHASGLAGAPILGNQEAWTPRVATGMATLFTNALQGLNAMPPRGGKPDLPEEDLKAAVGYMIYQVAPTEVKVAGAASDSETTQPAMDSDESASGEQVYNAVCKACHDQGIVGAPKHGDQDSWAPRVAKGMETLIANALQGFQGETGVMPAKGGGSDFSDEEVKAAVAYMLNAATAGDEILPEATDEETTTDDSTTATVTSAEPAATPAEAPAETVSSTEPSPEPTKGEQTYKTACFVCHDAGIAGAPKFGDQEAWAPRVAKGMEALSTSALQGLGAMPPKGGRKDLADDDIKAAAAYMVSTVQ